MRSIMPGYVNYYYKDGKLPTHTKNAFTSYNILTVHNVILKNMLIFINRILNFSTTLPYFIKQTISPNLPIPGTQSQNYSDWYTTYNSIPYKMTVFFKAPLLYYHIMSDNTELYSPSLQSTYKRNIKSYLLKVQKLGHEDEWQGINFMLTSVRGLRQSDRLRLRE